MLDIRVEVASAFSEYLERQIRRSEEWPGYPGKLATDENVQEKPGSQNRARVLRWLIALKMPHASKEESQAIDCCKAKNSYVQELENRYDEEEIRKKAIIGKNAAEITAVTAIVARSRTAS
ncbi:MAG TPA: hypothetical protein PKA27_06305 [Fimbriimonadaceae bacterium]|nr:hypothetical protein [Fimbriimonadaceae bacterium]